MLEKIYYLNEAFSGDLPCQYGVGVWFSRDNDISSGGAQHQGKALNKFQGHYTTGKNDRLHGPLS
jgi:hypothetical protein